MSKYFIEIRNRLFLLLLTWFSTISASYLYKEILLFSIIQPNIVVNANPTLFYFIFTNVSEIFSVYIELTLFISFQIFILYLCHHIFNFLSPSLSYFEYFYLNYIFKTTLIVWLFSIISLNYIIIPLTWDFFLSFQNLTSVYSLNLHFEAKLNEYLTFFIELYYLSVLYCQIIMILFVFLINTNTDTKVIKKFRKINYYFFVLFSTLISPPDILSQTLISVSMIIVYEMLLSGFIFKSSLALLIR